MRRFANSLWDQTHGCMPNVIAHHQDDRWQLRLSAEASITFVTMQGTTTTRPEIPRKCGLLLSRTEITPSRLQSQMNQRSNMRILSQSLRSLSLLSRGRQPTKLDNRGAAGMQKCASFDKSSCPFYSFAYGWVRFPDPLTGGGSLHCKMTMQGVQIVTTFLRGAISSSRDQHYFAKVVWQHSTVGRLIL